MSSADNAGDGPFPLPKGITVFAWKDGVPKQLKIKSSKVIKLDVPMVVKRILYRQKHKGGFWLENYF